MEDVVVSKARFILNIAMTIAMLLLLIAVLPISPFTNFVSALDGTPYLAYLNWFFPVGRCLIVMNAWLVAIAVYYGYQWVMRYLNLIG